MFLTFTFTAMEKKISKEIDNLFEQIYVVLYSIMSNELKDYQLVIKGLLFKGQKIKAEDNFITIMVDDGDDIIVISELREQNINNSNDAKIIGSFKGMDTIKQNIILDIVKKAFKKEKELKKIVDIINDMLIESLHTTYNIFIYMKNCGKIKYDTLKEEIFIEINGYCVSICKNN